MKKILYLLLLLSSNCFAQNVESKSKVQGFKPSKRADIGVYYMEGHWKNRLAELFLVKDKNVAFYFRGYICFLDEGKPIFLEGVGYIPIYGSHVLTIDMIGADSTKAKKDIVDSIPMILVSEDQEDKYRDRKNEIEIELRDNIIKLLGKFENGIYKGDIVEFNSNESPQYFEFRHVQNKYINFEHISCTDEYTNNFLILKDTSIYKKLIEEINIVIFGKNNSNFKSICDYSSKILETGNDTMQYRVRMLPIFVNEDYIDILVIKEHLSKEDGYRNYLEKKALSFSVKENRLLNLRDFVESRHYNILKDEIIKEIIKESGKSSEYIILDYEEAVIDMIAKSNIYVTEKGLGFVFTEESIYSMTPDIFIKFENIKNILKK